jgi:hypothetical protein
MYTPLSIVGPLPVKGSRRDRNSPKTNQGPYDEWIQGT